MCLTNSRQIIIVFSMTITYAGPDDDGSLVWSDDDGSVYASDDDAVDGAIVRIYDVGTVVMMMEG